jgi:HEAT repeat protein
VKPFSQRPLSEWIKTLQVAESTEDRYYALLAINSIGEPEQAVHWNRQALQDADPGIRARAARQLGEWKLRDASGASQAELWSIISTELVVRLADEDPDVRFEAARALGAVDPKISAARDILLSLHDDEETQPLMTAAVISALAQRTDLDLDVMIPRLKHLLVHSQAEVRENASAMVASIAEAASPLVNELLIALDDDEPIVRENAAIALGHSGTNDPQVLSALLAAGQDDDEGVAEAAQTACQRLSRH